MESYEMNPDSTNNQVNGDNQGMIHAVKEMAWNPSKGADVCLLYAQEVNFPGNEWGVHRAHDGSEWGDFWMDKLIKAKHLLHSKSDTQLMKATIGSSLMQFYTLKCNIKSNL